MRKIKKILIIGSGGLKIGQAGEFDYSGSQAIKAIKEEGIRTILVNPNIATIQTSEWMADQIYFLPITPYFLEKVIKEEKPDGILLSFGGQTALNCGVKLYKMGILKKYKVQVLGTPVQTIMDTEDRELFVKKLNEANLFTPKSKAVTNIKDALKAAKKIGYPVMVRSAYTLGGRGSGIVKNSKELEELAVKSFSYTNQILVEECLEGWKEVEFEVVRDKYDNCIGVCSMENFDPMGIHTGESIVIAPCQTLTNHEYHKLRLISLKTIRHLGIVGECNIQFALDPYSDEYRIIEVNARLSRSSALASKASGYPLAFIAAKLALGYGLHELTNTITKSTMAMFEPALDYVVIKVPRWDLNKFSLVSKEIGSGMKSVGEIMAIGRTFEETIQKAMRMLGIGVHGLVANRINFKNLEKELKTPTDERVFAIVQAIKEGYSVEKINVLTNIDKWFLCKIKNVVDTERELRKLTLEKIPKELLIRAKRQGFSDFQIARAVIREKAANMNKNVVKIRNFRKKLGIIPVVKQIDTLAAEYPAKANYLYLTYNGTEDDISFKEKKEIIVLGSGAYRIGSSVEFDWCCVSTVVALKKLGYKTLTINYNPETVSTDYDVCDKLYFDELTFERVMDVYEKENPEGIIVSMGGQIPNNLAMRLHNENVRVLGTSPVKIDNAENRHKFSEMLDNLKIDQPEWKELTNMKDAKLFARKTGYPVLIRPSYVLSGAAMNIASNDKNLEEYLGKAAAISKEYPVVISKFILNAKEIEIDAVAQNGKILVYAISEHVENAGVHSGDATMVLPTQKIYTETTKKIEETAKKIANALKITGPFNIQFIAKENRIKVIECNLRASRSFPFVSKVAKKDFIDIATKSIVGKKVKPIGNALSGISWVGIKSPQFSFSRLMGADPILGVEMASTGEVACIGENLNEAFLKSILSAGSRMPRKNVLISISGDRNRYAFLEEAELLKEMGFNIYATEDTSKFLNKNGIEAEMIYKAHNLHKEKNVANYMEKRKLDFVISVPNPEDCKFSPDHYTLRRKAVDLAIPLVTNLQLAKIFVQSIARCNVEGLQAKAWSEYI